MKLKKLKVTSSIKCNIALTQEADRMLYERVRQNGWKPMDVFRAGMHTLKDSKKAF